MSSPLSFTWIDGEREPTCAPNPSFPDGIDVDGSLGSNITCSVDLPHPAPRCGLYVVKCSLCRQSVALTTAGRADDPRSVKLACRARLVDPGETLQ